MQCGYCTPGMVMSGVALLEKNPSPSLDDVSRSLEGNVCRCGTYLRIATAIRHAADVMRKEGAK
jgi:aerobic-type carbon monoxide dehydrogenase small subunit (CoxS/CutS family)